MLFLALRGQNLQSYFANVSSYASLIIVKYKNVLEMAGQPSVEQFHSSVQMISTILTSPGSCYQFWDNQALKTADGSLTGFL